MPRACRGLHAIFLIWRAAPILACGTNLQGWKNARTEIEWIQEYRRIETQTITGARAEKLFPERGIRMLQNKARIPCFMPAPYHLGVCAAPAGSVNKLDALV